MNEYFFVFKEVASSEEAEMLRNIRNECRAFMTRNNAYISKEEQLLWFRNCKEKYFPFIVYNITHSSIICDAGYGVIHNNENEFMLSGGLLPYFRGKGLGLQLFKFLLNECLKKDSLRPIRLEALKSNQKAISIYKKLSFNVISETDKIVTMEYRLNSVI